MKSNEVKLQIFAWLTTTISILLALIVWGQSVRWHIFGTSTLLLFPVFGLIAFSLLWSQYVSLALSQLLKLPSQLLSKYFSITEWLVLLAILLHPGLFIWALWRDGFGLPPGSELHYVLPSLKFFVILGMINLIILLLFELRRFFASKTWWRPMVYLVDIAVIAVFIHGLKLGTQTQTGWYHIVWLLYGLTLLIAVAYINFNRYIKYKSKRPN